jgi:hypothetical protein
MRRRLSEAAQKIRDSRFIGLALLLVVIVSVVISSYLSHLQLEQARALQSYTQCQNRVNEQFLVALKHNTFLSRADREMLLQLIVDIQRSANDRDTARATQRILDADTPEESMEALKALIEASETNEGGRQAIDRFLERRKQLDQQRAAYPDLPSETCQ